MSNASQLPRDDRSGLLRRLSSFDCLEHGWDGDDAPAPSGEACRRALSLIEGAARPPDEVDPDAAGGIALWFYSRDGRKVMVGLRNEGNRAVLCSYAQASATPEVAVFSNDTELLKEVNAKAARF
jgi:hypothetical protein